MSVERLLQITIAVLLTLGTLLRSPGQRDFLLPLLLLAAAAASIYVTDIKKWFRLSHRVANVAALLSVAFALHDFFALDSAAQLSAIARLLTYLQITLLFQEKNARLYWQFFTLSVLQVVVGAALNVSMLFGLLMVLYMFVGLFALKLFFVYREEADRGRDKSLASKGIAERVAVNSSPDGPRLQLLLRPKPFWSGPSRNPTVATVGWQSLSQAAFIGGGSLLITAVLFIVAPRSGKSDWTAVAEAGSNTMTGFTPNVKLGDLGTIAQNSQPVMRVRLVDEAGSPLALIDQPLFRGSLLNYYTNGSWSFHPPRLGRRLWSPPQASDDLNYVRQEITIEPLNEVILFSIYPPVQIESSRAVQFNQSRMQFSRPQRRADERISFVLGTTGIYRDKQWPLVPQFGPADGPEGGLPRADDPDEDQPGEIKAIADRVLREANVPADDRVARANTLLAYLRDSGNFEYSLERAARNPNVDPIVDFLRTNRRGHCEYFASALCLMLRSQGIPARIVAGFYGDWNPLTQDYQVRQMHAHTWVEAYLEAEQIPADLQPPDKRFPGGGWLTLDPTPGVVTDATTRRGVLAPLANAVDYTQIMWNTYVVGMSKSFQYERFYGPILQWTTGVARSIGDASREMAAGFWQWLSADSFGWQGVVLLLLLGIGIAAGVWMVRVVRRWRARRAMRALLGGRSSSQRIVIDFYRRLEELLARRGLVRAAGQTPREFAVSIAPHLALLSAAEATRPVSRIADLPRQIVDAFYRIRYGGRQLQREERETIEQSLAELAARIDRRDQRAAKRGT